MLKKTVISLVLSFALILLMVSSVAITADAPELTTSVTDGKVHKWQGPVPKGVVWDNGMDYIGLGASQSDPASGLDPIEADDFMFEQDQLVNDVHWIGGYYIEDEPPYDGNFDWEITFYDDFGDGTKPGAVIATYLFPNAQVNETKIDSNEYGYYCSYSVKVPKLYFSANTKYWISIQGIGAYPPQSGWAVWDDDILLHQAVFKSVYFGYPDWTNTSEVFSIAVDMCFQLTFEHKMHFPQMPDLIGWDVKATYPKILADDWQCSATGPVEDIHFWGSWKNLDGMPGTDDFYTEMPWFLLSIHANIPADIDTPYSRPGRLLWQWEGEIPGNPSEPPTLEAWYDPNTDSSICNDHIPYWQYDFYFDQVYPPPESLFFQYEDSIYWLNISALNIPYPYQWGWKNSRDHFMDDAVFRDDDVPTMGWQPMFEPPRNNWFDVYFDATGTPEDWESSNYYGDGWYKYEYWWNMWFYDNPFTYDKPKEIFIDNLWVAVYGPNPYAEFAINWSTPEWDELGMGRPPLPEDGNEELYIGRYSFGPLPLETLLDFEYSIPYNPEWVSIDFVATDVVINGWIYHECVQTSMDLAFVITGEEECTPSIDVEKKVWDEDLQDWVDSTEIDSCSNADFLITIHNDGTCCDLTNIIVDDFMDASLEYLTASPDPDYVDPTPTGTLIGWSFPGPLEPCNTIDITVTAHVVGPPCHLDSNYVWAQGDCEEQAVGVYDEDVAYVHATRPPWPDHKMHYPQLPDPNGWDIVATMGHDLHPGIVVADDFECTRSVPITDLHFWGSWLYDDVGEIFGFFLSIHDNVIGPPSHPGEELWSAYITDFDVALEGEGLQGWYDPYENWWEHPNHSMYFRYDIDSIPEPFYQDSGTIYWLNICADIGPPGYQGYPEPPLWGWKTSLDHWTDDAVWSVFMPPYAWTPLFDPITGLTLDMAFVITGEAVPCNPPTIGCPVDETQNQNGVYTTTTQWSADDGNPGNPNVWLTSVTVQPPLPPGISAAVVNVNPPGLPAKTATGTVTYTVSDHCQPGGPIILMAKNNCPPPNTATCSFNVILTNDLPVITQPDSLEGYVNDVVEYDITGDDPNGDIINDGASIQIEPDCGTYSITRTSGSGTSSGTWHITWNTDGCTACITYLVIHDLTDTCEDIAYCTTKVHLSEEVGWHWKDPYEDYAPNGMPDIDQRQDSWIKAETEQWTFCGPCAVANCFKWFDSKYNVPPGVPGDGSDMFPLVRQYIDVIGGMICPWDDHDPFNVDHPGTPWQFGATLQPPPTLPQPFVPGPQPAGPMPPWGELVERLAWYFNTDAVQTGYCDHSGTNVLEMQEGIDEWLESEFFDTPGEQQFVRGDINEDGMVNTSDVIACAGGGPFSCDDAADVNDDGVLDANDCDYLADYLFGGPEPPPPFPNCGRDPTPDGLRCADFPSCPNFSNLTDTLCEVTTKMPTFAYLESLVEKCEDVILLLGFWYEDPPGSGEWWRVGGHYVTVAGVNSQERAIAFSDPFIDAFEMGMAPGRVGDGIIIDHPHGSHDPTVHNDEGNICHDIYWVLEDPISPGGLWWLPEYAAAIDPPFWMWNFEAQNVPEEFQDFFRPWNGESYIFTEVEYCVHISPWDYRGDVNIPYGDGIVELGDIVFLINFVFRGGDPPIPYWEGDVNCDGVIELGDIVFLINYVFRNGPVPRCCDP
jgi:hypothetical protein